MAATQADVARLAGVAPKTVSNVLSNYIHVGTATRERVLQAMEELDYRPNRAAQSLRTGRTGLLGLAVPEIDVNYFAELARHVVEQAGELGYTVLVVQTLGDPSREAAVLDGFDRQLTDGLLFSPVAFNPESYSRRRDGSPVVVLGEQVGIEVVDHVGVDNVGATREATRHLVDGGRQRIGFLGIPQETPTFMAQLRHSGYVQGLHDAGLDADPELSPRLGGFHHRHGYEAMSRVIRARPDLDAVVCANDHVAQGAIRAVFEAGRSVPEDVAVVGFDDIEESRYSRPTLTSIAQDKQEIARIAVRRLVEKISAPDTEPANFVTAHVLRPRESSQPR